MEPLDPMMAFLLVAAVVLAWLILLIVAGRESEKAKLRRWTINARIAAREHEQEERREQRMSQLLKDMPEKKFKELDDL